MTNLRNTAVEEHRSVKTKEMPDFSNYIFGSKILYDMLYKPAQQNDPIEVVAK